MSANTGLPPALTIADIVGIAVLAAVIISSPAFKLSDLREIKSASVPLPTAMPYFDLYFLINSFSKDINCFPKKVLPFKIVLLILCKNFFLYFYTLSDKTKI